jgi:hypothetical protein
VTKPSVTTHAVKAAPLTYTELDTNFTNLRDATLSVTAGTGGTQVTADLNGNITLVAGTGITLTGNNTNKTIVIDSESGGGLDYFPVNNLIDIDFLQTASPAIVTLQDGFTHIRGDIKNLNTAEIRLELRELTRNKTHYCVVQRIQTTGPSTGTLNSDWRYNVSGFVNPQNSNGIRVWEITVIDNVSSTTGVFVKATTQNISAFTKYIP